MTPSPAPQTLDPTRVALALGVVATAALLWLCAIVLFGAEGSGDSSVLTWSVLFAACLAIVVSPTVARAGTRAQALSVGAFATAALVAVAVLGFALQFVPLGAMTVVTAAIGAALALGVIALVHGGAATTASPAPAPVLRPMPSTLDGSPTTTTSLTNDGSLGGSAGGGPALTAGSRLGRYTLQDRLAVGGMGEVWRASHDTLIRPAVLKIIKRQPTESKARDAELIERFRREAMVTANLTSPHTVHLYDFGIEGETILYIAMELLEAMSIAAIVERFGPMSEARVAFLLRQACHSLIEAHEGGVVHRDLKPDNLLVTRAGRDPDFLKVIDFGLVKELSGSRRRAMSKQMREQQLTAMGARPGTPGYMAPEQIGGNAIDQRADIYALACVAYYAVTGAPVFEGTEDAQLMFAHMQVEPEPPSQRLGKPLHPGLEAVIMRCLAKNPAERPESMVALDDALGALAFEVPWTQDRARSWWTDERNKLRTRAKETLSG